MYGADQDRRHLLMFYFCWLSP